ncbi:DAK2 domain-containing protein [[Mycoplasma] mobile]|uniref:Predicted kinase n=1 Tax=Mycoplasma mobile (strain ATCC 43663 / 163K / NCTC 11711) TaxID=267748 RepID=Q6KHN1_MYCM1|nr:DAK2 domain-containing protein [[Mycoplasma] mobile]AAT27899.1 predicted kinase [Mycoplasma mobile 163K]
MEKITSEIWSKALVSGANNLINKKNWIDSLNVFPVPDGDTGSNMSNTIKSGVKDLGNESTIGEVSKKIARGMLLGARGNSGVILSQIFQGFAKSFENKIEINAFELVAGFEKAKEYAYKSVLNPVEGTILTVIKDVSEALTKHVTPAMNNKEIIALAYKNARKSCDNTPNLLPILKEVGVNDSGGEGLVLVIEGMLKYLEGNPVSFLDVPVDPNIEAFISNTEIFDGEFGYCTEFLLDLEKTKKFNKENFISHIEKLGTSLVVVQNEALVKVHIHTLKPGKVFNYAQKYGEFLKLKSENMTEQTKENRENQKQHQIANSSLVKNPSGLISCNTGQGLIHIMKENGCDFIIEAGQSSNPSAGDFIEAIKQVNSDNIFILPNNSNIILAAQQAAQIVTDKNVYVVPTKTQMEGISAIFNFNKELDFEDNKEEMEDAIDSTKTGEVTIAVKTTKINDVKVTKGEFIGLANRKVVISNKSLIKTAKKVIDKIISEDAEIATIYYGAEVSEIDAKDLKNYVESKYDIESKVEYGGQPLYHFYISVEE